MQQVEKQAHQQVVVQGQAPLGLVPWALLCGDSGRVDVAGECYRTRFLSSPVPPCKPWLPRRPIFPPAPSRPCPFPSASPHSSLLGFFDTLQRSHKGSIPRRLHQHKDTYWLSAGAAAGRSSAAGAGAAPPLAFSGCPTTIFPQPSPHPQATHSPPPAPYPNNSLLKLFCRSR